MFFGSAIRSIVHSPYSVHEKCVGYVTIHEWNMQRMWKNARGRTHRNRMPKYIARNESKCRERIDDRSDGQTGRLVQSSCGISMFEEISHKTAAAAIHLRQQELSVVPKSNKIEHFFLSTRILGKKKK